jgi:hypothetical protein
MERKEYVRKAVGAVLYKAAQDSDYKDTETQLSRYLSNIVDSAINAAFARHRSGRYQHDFGGVNIENITMSGNNAHKILTELFVECHRHRLSGITITSIMVNNWMSPILASVVKDSAEHKSYLKQEIGNVSAISFA